MKKLILLVFFSLIISGTVYSQPCLPDGIVFTSQTQIDSFQIIYPNCNIIEGEVEIRGHEIENLIGLSLLTTFGSDLLIESTSLDHFNGLDNITSIKGNLEIINNWDIYDFTGFDNLNSIGGHFTIKYENNVESRLYDLTGLGNLKTIGGNMVLYNNRSLLSLSGINHLDSIYGDFTLKYNELESIEGLENVTYLGGDLTIVGNHYLSSLSGLNNLNPNYIGNINISSNISLSDCAIESICNYLSSPPGSITIRNNATGCDNPVEIADLCGINLPCLPYGNYFFSKQVDIDSFKVDYPNCTQLEGLVNISGSNIVNLHGLNEVTIINGDLELVNLDYLENLEGLENIISIENNIIISHIDSLIEDLTGLDNLSYIGGNVDISYNSSLKTFHGLENIKAIHGDLTLYSNTGLEKLSGLNNIKSIQGMLYFYEVSHIVDLTGFDSLNFVGGSVKLNKVFHVNSFKGLESLDTIIGSLMIYSNGSLEDLSGLIGLKYIEGSLIVFHNAYIENLNGLDSLTKIQGDLIISKNYSLIDISAIENIKSETIENLDIIDNYMLSFCNVKSICDYLINPNGEVAISNNESGCNSQEEIEEACIVGEHSKTLSHSKIIIFPNPTKNEFAISSLGLSIIQVNVYNQYGNKVLSINNRFDKIDVSILASGIYIIEIVSDKYRMKEKLIIN